MRIRNRATPPLAGWTVFLVLPALALLPASVAAQGAPLGPEFRVNTFTTGNQRTLASTSAVAADGFGNFVVVWQSDGQDGSGEGVFGQRYDSSGAPFGPEFRVSTFTTGDQGLPAAAADLSGNFVVVWQSGQDGAGDGIFGQRYDSSGTPLGPEFRVNTFTTGNQRYPAVSTSAATGFVVTWASDAQDGASFGVFGQRYDSAGAPLGPEFRSNTFTTNAQSRASVASDPFGNFVVMWRSFTQDGSSYGVFGQRYASSGAPLGGEFRANTFTTSGQGRPSVAADASGNFVVVWGSYTQDGSAGSVFGQRYASSGAPLGGEFRVNTFTTNSQYGASVAGDAAGNFVVSWMSVQDGGSGGYGVFGQRYAGSGAPLGPEFHVNTFTTNLQGYTSVASDPSGNFVVVWQSYGQDGDGYGIFGQRFGQIVPVELMRLTVE